MMTKTELNKVMTEIMEAFKRAPLEEQELFTNEEYTVVFMPATESKLVMDTYFERKRLNESETFIMVGEETVYGLWGDHREKCKELEYNLEAMKKYWKSQPELWSALPGTSTHNNGNENKPQIGFGIPVAKAA